MIKDSKEAGFAVTMVEGVYFYSCYAQPSLSLAEFLDFLDRLIKDAKQHSPVAIAGDFNSWAVDWGSKETNKRGEALLEAMAVLDLVLLNSGNKPTFIRGEATSIIDVTFVSGCLAKGHCSWQVLDTYTASDHCAILWTIASFQRVERIYRRTNGVSWKVSAFDNTAFSAALNKNPLNESNVEKMVKVLMRRVCIACDASMPRKRNTLNRQSVYWWNEEISWLRKDCLKKRRASQRGRKKPNSVDLLLAYKAARRRLNMAIKDSKRKCWTELIDEVERDPWGRPYKVVTTRLKSQTVLPMCHEVLAKIITTLFPQQPDFYYQIEHVEKEKIPPVTESELIAACNRVGNKKAPGLDGIPNVSLKAAIKEAPSLFLTVYNTCLQEATFPTKWKEQRLVLLPKGKKAPDDPSSYRPLCMLDTAGKILERILQQRIEAAVDPLLATNQYGFRKGRSTLDAINVVTNIARDAIAGTRWKGGTKKYCLVVTLDIRNAFNSASWECIMRVLIDMNVPAYLRNMVASYFSDRLLKYDTRRGPKEYKITGGVPQGSVLGPLLWNIMYDGLLKEVLPKEVKLVAYADDVAVVIVAKHLEEINYAWDSTYGKITNWMKSVKLELAEHKTEAVLISSRKKLENIKLRVGNHIITSQSSLRYLGVIIDARLNFKHQAENVSTKAAVIGASLSRLMPNVGGPKQKRRALLASVITSVLTYGISVWADTLQIQESRRKIVPIYRRSALRVTSAFRTVSEDAVCVIAGMLPIVLLAEERQALHQQKVKTTLRAEELRAEQRQTSIRRWQAQWNASTKGRWTHRLIPQLDTWLNREHGDVNYHLTQMLSGHGCFRAYLYRFKHEESPECPACPGTTEDAEHVLRSCPRFSSQRNALESALGQIIQPETLVGLMLTSKEAWDATNVFAKEVLQELRRAERQRSKDGLQVK